MNNLTLGKWQIRLIVVFVAAVCSLSSPKKCFAQAVVIPGYCFNTVTATPGHKTGTFCHATCMCVTMSSSTPPIYRLRHEEKEGTATTEPLACLVGNTVHVATVSALTGTLGITATASAQSSYSYHYVGYDQEYEQCFFAVPTRISYIPPDEENCNP